MNGKKTKNDKKKQKKKLQKGPVDRVKFNISMLTN